MGIKTVDGEIRIGDFVSDGCGLGVVLEVGTLQDGKEWLTAYKVDKGDGREDMMLAEFTRLVAIRDDTNPRFTKQQEED